MYLHFCRSSCEAVFQTRTRFQPQIKVKVNWIHMQHKRRAKLLPALPQSPDFIPALSRLCALVCSVLSASVLTTCGATEHAQSSSPLAENRLSTAVLYCLKSTKAQCDKFFMRQLRFSRRRPKPPRITRAGCFQKLLGCAPRKGWKKILGSCPFVFPQLQGPGEGLREDAWACFVPEEHTGHEEPAGSAPRGTGRARAPPLYSTSKAKILSPPASARPGVRGATYESYANAIDAHLTDTTEIAPPRASRAREMAPNVGCGVQVFATLMQTKFLFSKSELVENEIR